MLKQNTKSSKHMERLRESFHTEYSTTIRHNDTLRFEESEKIKTFCKLLVYTGTQCIGGVRPKTLRTLDSVLQWVNLILSLI